MTPFFVKAETEMADYAARVFARAAEIRRAQNALVDEFLETGRPVWRFMADDEIEIIEASEAFRVFPPCRWWE